ncbi:hypothetical protein D0869_01419 [Hortaea werneckii]|uniref:Plasma membrane proteolipid 3 n=1 Tax=Hortaea werneckii TaxID=91943 RepID=A0A3M6XD19_HORWE|nr:hypothetical protein D0869_01419 [Hortaea werneckii]
MTQSINFRTHQPKCLSPEGRKSAASLSFATTEADNKSRSDIIKIIFAIILPPVGVFLERGCGADFLINILLTILGYIPGIIHALYVLIP